MLQPKKMFVNIMLAGSAAGLFGACERSPVASPTKLPSAHTAADDSYFESLFAEDEFAVANKTPHCIALVAEVAAHRLAFTQSASWEKILRTEEWTRFHGLYTGYRSGGCPDLTTKQNTISQPCLEGREALFNAWNDVKMLEDWKLAAAQGTQLKRLTECWNDAKAVGCLLTEQKP